MPRAKSKSVRFEDETHNETLRGLVTPLEEHLQQAEEAKVSLKTSRRGGNETFTEGQQEEQEQQINNIPMSQIKQVDAEKLSVLVNQLIAKNKINAKNAFEVPLVHLNETSDYNSMNGDNSWKKVSSTLQNNNKIYGYRVDATHNFTYKMLQLVTRTERKQVPQDEQQYRSHRYDNNSLNTQFFSDCIEDYYIRHLERNQKNINIMHLDTFFNVNPILEKTKRTFDQQGLKGLLLNNIEIDQELALCITLGNQRSNKKIGPKSDGQAEVVEVETGQGLLSYNIFTKIYAICCINDLLEEESTDIKREQSQFQTMWKDFQETAKPQKREKRQHQSVELDNEQNPTPQNIVNEVQQLLEAKSASQKDGDEDEKISEENKENNHDSTSVGQQNKAPLAPIIQTNIAQEDDVQSNKDKVQSIPSQGTGKAQGNTQSKSVNEESEKEKQQIQQTEPNRSQQNHLKEQKQLIQYQQPPQISVLQGRQIINPAGNEQAQDEITSQTTNGQVLAQSTNNPQEVRQVPIASVIKLNSRRLQPEHRLHQMDVLDQYTNDKQSAVEKWKNSDKKPKVQRKPKQPRDPKLDYINFKQPLDMRKKMNRRSNILKVDKVKKLQVKKFLKSTQNHCKDDRYLYSSSSRQQLDLKLLSLLRQTVAQSTRLEEEDNQENYQANHPDVIDLQSLSQTLASNITKSASIRSVKEKVRNFMVEKKIESFVEIYSQFVNDEGYISPALCFLTCLHLSNEHGLKLVQEQSSDFKILWE